MALEDLLRAIEAEADEERRRRRPGEIRRGDRDRRGGPTGGSRRGGAAHQGTGGGGAGRGGTRARPGPATGRRDRSGRPRAGVRVAARPHPRRTRRAARIRRLPGCVSKRCSPRAALRCRRDASCASTAATPSSRRPWRVTCGWCRRSTPGADWSSRVMTAGPSATRSRSAWPTPINCCVDGSRTGWTPAPGQMRRTGHERGSAAPISTTATPGCARAGAHS